MSSHEQHDRDIARQGDMELRTVEARVVEILNPVVPELSRLHEIINSAVPEHVEIIH